MQSRKNSIVRLGVGVSLLAVLSACGSSSSGAGGRGSGTGGTISGTGASAGSAQGGASNAGVGGSSGAPQSGGSSGAASGIGGSQSSGGMTFNLDGSAPPSCAAQKAPGSIRPLALDVLLDQSGSMGVKPHDYDTKWAPVTAALKSFFSDPSSANIYSALTFFPVSIPPEPNQSTAAVTAKCDFNSYVTPWVPMTALPSGIFATAIDMQTPNCYSTTTLPTVQGAIVYLQGVAQQMPNSKQAIVLVTDGDPTICPGNTIAAISAELQSVKDQIPTYVIGVGNVNGLNTLAASGG
ncbi:MAG TPA: vWA domain-containing protein, partial [Polyangiaceae bacterium]